MENMDPKNELKSLSPNRKELQIVISSEEVLKELDDVTETYTERARIPGFRAGKAPHEHVRRLFAEDIRQSAVENLIPRALDRELKSRGVQPVGTPVVEELDFEGDGPLRARVTFDVVPDFEIPDYRSIRISAKDEQEVKDEDILKAVEDLRSRAAEYVPVEGRGVEDGDYVVFEMQGKDLKSRKLFPVEKAVVLAGRPENEPFLNEHLPGVSLGGERTFTTTYESSHPNRKLAGRTVEYRLRVGEIKERKLPDIDDDFARRLGDYGNLEELKADVRSKLQEVRREAVKKETAHDVVKAVTENVDLEPPESLVDNEMAGVLRRMAASLPQGGKLSPEAAEKLKTEARKQARQNIKSRLVLQEIAKREGLVVTPEDVREEIALLARAEGVHPDALFSGLQEKGHLDPIRENLLTRKAVDFLVGNAIIK